jgi:hypothetical protein
MHALLLPALFAALPAAATVTVKYIDPDHFTDVADRNTDARTVMKTLDNFLAKLGDRYLPAGSNLRIDILDIDRAGRPRFNVSTDIRVITGVGDRPCVELSYTLETNGTSTQPLKEKLCDSAYQMTPSLRADDSDLLKYEQRMLEEWFRKRFEKK